MSTTSAGASAALGLTSLTHEIPTPQALPVQGELPAWLTGSLVRTGPANWDISGHRLRHWFDGLAMLHHFGFADRQVRYANRYLQSRTYRKAQETGKIPFREFATDPCRSIFQRVQSLFTPSASAGDNANVNVGRLGERFVAMTETPIPVQFDRDTLAAAGVPFRAPGELTTAHPHYDRDSGAMFNYATKLGARSHYRIFRVDPADAGVEVIAEMPVSEPAYMHSFGITENYFVLTEFPLVVNPLMLAVSGRPFIENYRWEPRRGTRFTLINRHDGRVHRQATTDAFFAFHHVNAYEDGDDVIVDLCSARDNTIINELYIDRLHDRMRRQDGRGFLDAYPMLTRYRMRTADASITAEQLSEEGMDLPVINHRRYQERPHRYVWGVGSDGHWLDRILKVDTGDRETRAWRKEGCYPGEPVFVERPGATEEDDGVLLSVVLDSHKETSSLLVLDAATLDEVAQAEVPHHIPYGFHGTYTRR